MEDTLPESKKLRVGVIGLGDMGTVHVRTLSTHPAVLIAAAADTNEQKLHDAVQTYGIRRIYRDYNDMLRDGDLDVIDIVLPHAMHKNAVCASLIAGMNVICEKPLAVRSEEILAIGLAAQKSRRQVYLKQYFRFSTLHELSQQLILSGEIGRPYLISCLYTGNGGNVYRNQALWKGTLALGGGGVFMDVGVHIIDYLQEFLGPPLSVFCSAKKNLVSPASKGEDIAAALVEFRGSIIANIVCTAADTSYGFRWEKHFYGTEGSIHIEDFGKERMELSIRKNQREVRQESEEDWWDKANRQALFDIVERLRNGEPPAVPLWEAGKTIETITAAYESARRGRRIVLH